ncbi:uncharacterized protein LOC121733630 isoform X2 [Aricia agestis]|uniref:uncharacterized protein LOC121733630 isoform X2 n=1 Tax=Aricia agestis TaxID=91739 RepID=UPI001C2085D0|nr:uncharacterized protein LOC121733630 isoform X2 [Aricia agestis]
MFAKRKKLKYFTEYVNVCAAVCLVLLVGDILPLSSAAPRRRTMSRDRRSTEENSLWGNPCDYGANVKATKYSAKLASRVANQARSAYKSTSSYKDEFASKLHSYSNFEKLLPVWSGYDWLRNFTWFREEVLPKEKVINGEMPPQYLDELMNHIDEVLPVMYKGLKMIVAGLNSISQEGLNEDIFTDVSMKQNIAQSVQDVRAVLCVFFDVMKSRNLEIPPLLDSEVQDISKEEKLRYSLLVYRDTLNYLEYLAQVFQKMNDMEQA